MVEFKGGVTARIFRPQKFSGRKLPLAEVFLGKVLLALVLRLSRTFPRPAVEIFRRRIFPGWVFSQK